MAKATLPIPLTIIYVLFDPYRFYRTIERFHVRHFEAPVCIVVYDF